MNLLTKIFKRSKQEPKTLSVEDAREFLRSSKICLENIRLSGPVVNPSSIGEETTVGSYTEKPWDYDVYFQDLKISPVKTDDGVLKKLTGGFVTLYLAGKDPNGNSISDRPAYHEINDLF